ncbi:MAG: hypothetical protein ACKV0T_23320 [Planctomycetales bacterium]
MNAPIRPLIRQSIPRGARRRAPHRGSPDGHESGGFSLVELTIAAVLTSTILISSIPAMGWVLRMRQASERRQAALICADNLLERLIALPFDELTLERAEQIADEGESHRQWPQAEWRLEVDPTDGDLAKRIVVELRWEERVTATPSSNVRLATWVYAPQKESP